jgi:hypothetical protein
MLSWTNFLLAVIYTPFCPVKPQPSEASVLLFDGHAIAATDAQFPMAFASSSSTQAISTNPYGIST